MTATEKFDQIVKEALNARDILIALQKRLEEFTIAEVDEVNARRPEDYEIFAENIITATINPMSEMTEMISAINAGPFEAKVINPIFRTELLRSFTR